MVAHHLKRLKDIANKFNSTNPETLKTVTFIKGTPTLVEVKSKNEKKQKAKN